MHRESPKEGGRLALDPSGREPGTQLCASALREGLVGEVTLAACPTTRARYSRLTHPCSSPHGRLPAPRPVLPVLPARACLTC